MQDSLDKFIADFNTEIAAVSAKIDTLRSELAAAFAGGHAPTQAQLDSLQSISDKLAALGTPDAQPAPVTPPADPVAPPTPAG